MMDRERLNYDLALAYAKEYLRRLDNDQFMSFAQYAGQVKGIFETVYECLCESGSNEQQEI